MVIGIIGFHIGHHLHAAALFLRESSEQKAGQGTKEGGHAVC